MEREKNNQINQKILHSTKIAKEFPPPERSKTGRRKNSIILRMAFLEKKAYNMNKILTKLFDRMVIDFGITFDSGR